MRRQAKSRVGGRATHDPPSIPKGRLGPLIHLCSLRSKISVSFDQYSLSVFPPVMMIDCIDPSSDLMAQLK